MFKRADLDNMNYQELVELLVAEEIWKANPSSHAGSHLDSVQKRMFKLGMAYILGRPIDEDEKDNLLLEMRMMDIFYGEGAKKKLI